MRIPQGPIAQGPIAQLALCPAAADVWMESVDHSDASSIQQMHDTFGDAAINFTKGLLEHEADPHSSTLRLRFMVPGHTTFGTMLDDGDGEALVGSFCLMLERPERHASTLCVYRFLHGESKLYSSILPRLDVWVVEVHLQRMRRLRLSRDWPLCWADLWPEHQFADDVLFEVRTRIKGRLYYNNTPPQVQPMRILIPTPEDMQE